MTAFEAALDDIQDLNLNYLLIAQRLLSEDFITACVRLGLDAEPAKVLRNMSLAQVRSLASTPMLIVGMRLSTEALCSVVRENINEVIQRTRATIACAAAQTPAKVDFDLALSN